MIGWAKRVGSHWRTCNREATMPVVSGTGLMETEDRSKVEMDATVETEDDAVRKKRGKCAN